MNYLTDSEIMDWNTIITDTNFFVSPIYNNRNSYPSINFNLSNNFYGTSGNRDVKNNINIDPIISYNITFSILKSGKDIFSKIRNSIFSIDLENEILYKEDKYLKINMSSLEIQESESLILFKNKSYISFKISLKGNTSSVMAYFSLIKRCLNFYEKTWGFDNKEEKLLLPFKIGDIVTPINNTIDMIVIDYIYDVYYNAVKYISKEIIDKGSYILYVNENVYSSDKIVLSRNNKLEILLED